MIANQAIAIAFASYARKNIVLIVLSVLNSIHSDLNALFNQFRATCIMYCINTNQFTVNNE